MLFRSPRCASCADTTVGPTSDTATGPAPACRSSARPHGPPETWSARDRTCSRAAGGSRRRRVVHRPCGQGGCARGRHACRCAHTVERPVEEFGRRGSDTPLTCGNGGQRMWTQIISVPWAFTCPTSGSRPPDGPGRTPCTLRCASSTPLFTGSPIGLFRPRRLLRYAGTRRPGRPVS